MNLSGRKLLITGGASLIGSHIAEELLARDVAGVVLFDNYSLGSPQAVEHLLSDPRVQLVRGDILRINEVLEALDGVSGVFHVAGFLTLVLSQNPWTGIDVNVRGHQTVLEACRWRGVEKVVFSSSAAVYGSPSGDVVETVPFNWAPLQPAGAIYGATKIIGENLCRLYGQRYGLQFNCMRYSSVYGERQHYRGVNALYIIEAYDRIKRGLPPELPGDGSEVHDYVYAGDVARANVLAMASDVTGESFSVVTGVETTLNDITRILLRLCNSNLEPVYKDDPSKVRFTTTTELHYSREKAKQLLGWEPQVSVEEGIRRIIAWRERELVAT